MSGDWIIRWDVRQEPRPTLWIPEAGAEKSVAFFGPPDPSGAGGFAVCSGYLFEKTDLHPDAHASEADCVAAAYRQHGECGFDRLRGGWSAAVWDAERGQLLAGRDALGLHPLYYCWDAKMFLLSPELDLLLAQPEVSRSFNRVALAEYLQNTWHAHQLHETFYEQVSRVPAAHYLRLVDGRSDVQRYWDPLPPGFHWADDEELETFYPVLERAVARCLEAGGDSLSLSGGFDSVSIAVLAAGQLRGRPPLHAVSLRFTIGAIDEGEIQTAVARALGMPLLMRTVSEYMAEKSIVEASLDLSATSPLPVLSLWQSMYSSLYKTASTQGLSKLLDGTGGDEMFLVDARYARDCLRDRKLGSMWRFYRAMQRSSSLSSANLARLLFWDEAIKPLMIQTARSAIEVPFPRFAERVRKRSLMAKSWLRPTDPLIEEKIYDRRLHPADEDIPCSEGEYVQAIRDLCQSTILMGEQEQRYFWTRQAGFTAFHPYFDRDVVGLSLRMHPDILISGGRSKGPLRRLVAERLPEVRLPTRKVSFNQPVHVLLREQGQTMWNHLGGAVHLADLRLIDPSRINPVMEAYFSGKNNYSLLAWIILSAESWLRAR